MAEEVASASDARPPAIAPQAPASQAIALVPIDLRHLHRLAASQRADFDFTTVAEAALPPAHVAAQALAGLQAGTPACWCVPYLIVARSRDAVLGGCRFKSAPVDGRVEIGYGVAPSERGCGIGSAAVAELLRLATASGAVRQVVAHILPDNAASSRVVARLGFIAGSTLVDPDGEVVVPWIRPIPTDLQRELP